MLYRRDTDSGRLPAAAHLSGQIPLAPLDARLDHARNGGPDDRPDPRRTQADRTETPLALGLDHPQRQPPSRQDRRAQDRRASGVLRLPRHLDDGALFSHPAAPGPCRGQNPRRSRLSRRAVSFGRQSLEKLEQFRAYGGAQSYPSRTKDTDDVDFSTGSVGSASPSPPSPR